MPPMTKSRKAMAADEVTAEPIASAASRMLSANTSLGFGQGTVVDIRTFMYEVRKQVKMNVSLRRKIHIIAFPQGT